MTTRIFVAIVALLTVSLLCASAFDAEAARFGGGRSFGGSRSFSRPVAPSQLPSSAVRNPSAATQSQPGAAAAAPRSGFGGMGGIFGGLLAGTLIGSLLGGHGFAGGGMFDILLIAGALYLLFKFLGRRRSAQTGHTHVGVSMPVPDRDEHQYSADTTRGSAWDTLSGKSGSAAESLSTANVPAGFDQEDFLRGAKMLYQRMNDSWDKRDINDIAEFATQPFMAEIRQQAAESPDPEKTEIMLVNASLVSVLTEAGRETAAVYFNVLLREDPKQSSPTQVREVWHFVRAANSKDSWKLDGIQQVEDY